MKALTIVLLILATLIALSPRGYSQRPVQTIKIHAALVDKALNIKPVPRLGFRFTPLGKDDPVHIVTGFDGTATVALPTGKYRLTSDRPIDFGTSQYEWNVEIEVPVTGAEIDLSNDNATVVKAGQDRVLDPLTTYFQKRRSAVVTVWSEFGQGTGFIVDPVGLILTNQHVVGPSRYIAVQIDPTHKVSATLLAESPERDIAVLWANLSGLPGATAAPLAAGTQGNPPVEVGEEVFTIGSPMGLQKILTTGIVSKILPHAILSNININHGNSGGPLFNSQGDVVGITTFIDANEPSGPGVSGVVTIDQAEPLLSKARSAMKGRPIPSDAELPVIPEDRFPLDALKEDSGKSKFDTRPYFFREGRYNVTVITPPFQYWAENAKTMEAVRGKRHRRHAPASADDIRPLDDLRNWAQYLGEYQPTIEVRVVPELRQTFLSGLARGMAAAGGSYVLPAATYKYATDFQKMTLRCGDREITPILPGKVASLLNIHNPFVNVSDATYQGLYIYPANAISPSCGRVELDIYSEEKPDQPKVKILDKKTIERVWEDFQPYRVQEGVERSQK